MTQSQDTGSLCFEQVPALLQSVFSDVLDWHKSRIDFLCHFLVALIQVKTVNMVEVATAFGGSAKRSSKYKRIQRFFRGFEVDSYVIAELIVRLLALQGQPWVLLIDRSNWKWGQTDLNILMLAIAYKGIAVPLLWVLLPKRGNSNTAERIALMARFFDRFGSEEIDFFSADREFIGQAWFSYLLQKEVPFRIRIRENMLVQNAKGQPVAGKTLFRHLKSGQSHLLSGKRTVCGVALYVLGLRLPDGEYLILVTDHAPQTALDDYAKRWQIETLFGCLKSRGFRLEETHMTDPERLSKLLALFAIAFCWAHAAGEWLSQQAPIKLKTHGRKASSIFRYGLDHLRESLLQQPEKSHQLKPLIRLLRRRLKTPQKDQYQRPITEANTRWAA